MLGAMERAPMPTKGCPVIDMENLKAWQAVAVGIVSAILVMLGRVSGTRKAIRKDGAEGDLFTQLSSALKASEDRRAEEAAAHRKRETDHENRHHENMQRMLELTREMAEVKGALQVMERQYAEVTAHLQRSEIINRQLQQELSEYRQIVLTRLADLLPNPPPQNAPGFPATITK